MLHRPRTRIAIYAGILLTSGFAPAFSTALAADPTGDWRVADGVADIRIAQCGGSVWGAVSWEKTPGGKDVNNPDPAKKNRLTLGMPILIDMKRKPGADQWEGQVYNAKDGQYYSSTITPSDPDHLEIRGCVLGFLCGGETWTRVGPPIPSSPVNSMAKSSSRTSLPKTSLPKTSLPKTSLPKTTGTTAGAAGTPQTTGSLKPAAKHGPKTAGPGEIGDICLLPDIARLAH